MDTEGAGKADGEGKDILQVQGNVSERSAAVP